MDTSESGLDVEVGPSQRVAVPSNTARRVAHGAHEIPSLFEERFNAGDLEGLLDLYDREAVLVPTPGAALIQGTASLRQALGGLLETGAKLELSESRVIESGAVALVIHDGHLSGGRAPDGSAIDLAGRSSDVVRRQPDGTWRIVIDNPWGTARRDDQMTTNELKGIAARFFDEVWNRHDVGAIDRLFAPDFVDHYLATPRSPDREGFKQECAFYLTAMPDTTVSLEDQIAEGDRVASRVVFRGTNTGPFGPMPPTGKATEVTGCIILRIEGGLIVERWGNIDDLGALRQLGLVPAMPGSAAPA